MLFRSIVDKTANFPAEPLDGTAAKIAFGGAYFDTVEHMGVRVQQDPAGGYRYTVLRRLWRGEGLVAHDVVLPDYLPDVVDRINDPTTRARLSRVEYRARFIKMYAAALAMTAAALAVMASQHDAPSLSAPAAVSPALSPADAPVPHAWGAALAGERHAEPPGIGAWAEPL